MNNSAVRPTEPIDRLSATLPPGVIDLASSIRRRADRLLGHFAQPDSNHHGGSNRDGDGDRIRADMVDLLTAPLRLDEDWPAPTEPLAVPGGWVHVEVTDDDRRSLDQLLADRPDLGPEELARLCQDLRFPVSPYRLRSGAEASVDGANPLPADRDTDHAGGGADHQPDGADHQPGDTDHADDQSNGPIDLAGATVIDLTTHWAGPLATKLLAEAGADVVKIDPQCRPDGFRSRSGLYRHLNGAKDVVDLDLRAEADRRRFETMVAGADLVVESFSRRVMANLGYEPDALWALAPRASLLSIKAYPAGSPEQDWLAFGPGVHAAGGLGLAGPEATPIPAPVAYPDLLTGLTGFVEAIGLLGHNGRHRRVEVSLRGSIQPLVAPAGRPTGGSTDG